MQNKEQTLDRIRDWSELQTTQEFVALLEKSVKEVERNASNAYVPHQPQATQEFLANLQGMGNALAMVMDLINSPEDWIDE